MHACRLCFKASGFKCECWRSHKLLAAFSLVSPSNNNVMPLPLNTSDRRSSVEIGNNNST